jgi:hypothetical protein
MDFIKLKIIGLRISPPEKIVLLGRTKARWGN